MRVSLRVDDDEYRQVVREAVHERILDAVLVWYSACDSRTSSIRRCDYDYLRCARILLPRLQFPSAESYDDRAENLDWDDGPPGERDRTEDRKMPREDWTTLKNDDVETTEQKTMRAAVTGATVRVLLRRFRRRRVQSLKSTENPRGDQRIMTMRRQENLKILSDHDSLFEREILLVQKRTMYRCTDDIRPKLYIRGVSAQVLVQRERDCDYLLGRKQMD